MENQESLPKPELDLPLPEKEIPAQAPSVVSEKLSGKTIIAIAVVFLILLTVGVSLAYFLAKNSASKTSEVATPTVTPTVTPTPNPTANWKTYSNANYKVSFKYPSYLKLNSETDTSIEFINTNLDPNYVVLNISKKFSNHPALKPIGSTCSVDETPCFIQEPDFTISGITGNSFYEEINDSPGFKFIQLNNPHLEIKIQYGGADPNHIQDTILSTFKFTQ